MAINVSYYLQSAVWNGSTWDNTTGGSLDVTIEHGGDPLDDRTGIDEYNTFLAVVNKMCRATLRLREVKWTTNPGAAESNLVLTLKKKTGNTEGTVVVTLATMQLISVRSSQARASVGDAELVFMHRSADGSTVPVS